jgi:F-type H+-transporting ATPase subunit delta
VSHEAVARRYGRALFELGKETGELAALTGDFARLTTTWNESEELRAALTNVLVPSEVREAIAKDIGQALGLRELSVNAFRLLTRRQRLGSLPELNAQLARLVDESESVVRAEVTSAAPLGEGYLAQLKAQLEASTGRVVKLTHSVDPSLIAGLITKIGDRVIDGSARARLASFRDSVAPH